MPNDEKPPLRLIRFPRQDAARRFYEQPLWQAASKLQSSPAWTGGLRAAF